MDDHARKQRNKGVLGDDIPAARPQTPHLNLTLVPVRLQLYIPGYQHTMTDLLSRSQRNAKRASRRPSLLRGLQPRHRSVLRAPPTMSTQRLMSWLSRGKRSVPSTGVIRRCPGSRIVCSQSTVQTSWASARFPHQLQVLSCVNISFDVAHACLVALPSLSTRRFLTSWIQYAVHRDVLFPHLLTLLPPATQSVREKKPMNPPFLHGPARGPPS